MPLPEAAVPEASTRSPTEISFMGMGVAAESVFWPGSSRRTRAPSGTETVTALP